METSEKVETVTMVSYKGPCFFFHHLFFSLLLSQGTVDDGRLSFKMQLVLEPLATRVSDPEIVHC